MFYVHHSVLGWCAREKCEPANDVSIPHELESFLIRIIKLKIGHTCSSRDTRSFILIHLKM